ncbi:hypothetical protein AVEN_214474-1 [Araneus ventricosus]|uniref:Uncharacterized protein n=1 Tax=Araneus ventricosus TaxID=182803 RepID=A0A4Y2CWN7_ARAVE|nr:hypothetical protein AVEN_214474-1 [Araneus ventricosus]
MGSRPIRLSITSIETDFLLSEVTNRPLPIDQENVAGQASESAIDHHLSDSISPDQIRPLPCVNFEATNSRRGRRIKGKTRISTKSPEKKLSKCRSNQNVKRTLGFGRKLDTSVRNEWKNIVSSDLEFSRQDDVNDFIDPDNFPLLIKTLERDDFVLVEFEMEPNNKKAFYVGKVLLYENIEYEINFLRCRNKMFGKFAFPDVEDISRVSETSIKVLLPTSRKLGCAKRRQSYMSFGGDFNLLNIL